MIYGDLRFRDRLFRGVIGAVLGGGAGFLIALRNIMLGRSSHSSLLIPATILGAAIGGFLAFRRKKIGW
jgi:hypothetical protein